MRVKVILNTILKKYADGKLLEDNTLIINEDTTLQEVTCFLGIPKNIGTVFLVNNSPKNQEYRLQEGDEIEIFSLICGG